MFGFPINSQAGIETFTNNADSGFPKIQQREVFYSVRDGAWSNVNIWQTASGRVGIYPTRNDDVYIRHNVNFDPYPVSLLGKTIETFNLIVTDQGRIYGGPSSGYGVSVFGDFKCYGTFGFTEPGAISLYGQNNFIDKNKQETKLNADFTLRGDQPIMDAIYGTISASSGAFGIKYTTTDLIVDNISTFNSTAVIYVKNPHSLTCNITFNCWYFYSDTEYNLTFKGLSYSLYMFFCTRNPTIEFQKDIAFNQGNFAGNGFILPFPYGTYASIYLGTGLVKFTTNNIAINNTGTIYYDNTFLIDPNIVVTNNQSNHTMILNNTINGSSGTSQLINKGRIYFNSLTSISSMTTGIFDYTTFANTIGFTGNYTTTIPSSYSTFHNLTISGTGTKSLGVNTTLNGNLNCTGISSATIFETNGFNLSVTGTTSTNPGILKSSSFSSLLFVGAINNLNFDLITGNPNVEVRNGITSFAGAQPLAGGYGTWTFTTNNQSLFFGSSNIYYYGSVIISGAITLSITGTSGNGPYIYGTINGDNSLSTLNVQNGLFLYNSAQPNPMSSMGICTISTTTSTIRYMYNGNNTLPFTTYYNLIIDGTGTKTLSGNTTINGNLTGNQISTLDLTTYDLFVSGTSNAKYKKTSTGNITFVGLATIGSNSDFSGNPNIEFRNGINQGFQTGIISGTGQWKFSTNNQSIVLNSSLLYIDGSVLIDGAITLTINCSGTGGTPMRFNNSLNGNNANSKVLISASSVVTHNGATQPMATGILDTSTNVNTWIYGNANQDVKGNTYRNLTFNGGGTKTLQGNVSVQNTYTLTAPATVNLNGFTLTNP
jgi:hypothetical protein